MRKKKRRKIFSSVNDMGRQGVKNIFMKLFDFYALDTAAALSWFI